MLIEEVLELAKRHGATDCEVTWVNRSGVDTTVRLGKVEKLEFHNDALISITVYKGKRKASVSSTNSNAAALPQLVATACAMAEHTEMDKYAGLPDRSELATTSHDLCLDYPYSLDADYAIKIAQECEAAALEFDPKINNSEGATISTLASTRSYGNSAGFLGSVASTRYYLSCTALAECKGEKQRDADYSLTRNFTKLATAQQIGANAAKKTLARLGARTIKTGKVSVIFAAEVASSLLSSFLAAISGSNLYRKTSFLLDAVDQKIFADFINIKEQPHKLSGIGSSWFDAEGVATRSKDIVTAGVLNTYLLNS
ncbi:MAG: metalloprotease PmbA, partial [Legionellales bacterium]